MDAEVIILSSPPQPPPPRNNNSDDEGSLPPWPPSQRERPVPGTPPKARPKLDIWCIPTSSSPLRSPNELLRSIVPMPGVSKVGKGLGKGFKTARDMIESTGSKGQEPTHATMKVDETKIMEAKGKTLPPTQKKPKGSKTTASKPAAKRTRRTIQTKTVSAHFSKKGKSVVESSTSKSVSPIDALQFFSDKGDDETSKLGEPTQQTQRQNTLPGEALPQLPVPAGRLGWTPAEDSAVPIVLESSPSSQIREGNIPGQECPLSDENTPIRRFGKAIGSYQYKGIPPKPRITSTLENFARPLHDTTRRCLKALEKPNSRRSLSTSATEDADITSNLPIKKGRKKPQTITDLATAQFRTAENSNSAEGSNEVLAVEAAPPKKPRAPRKPRATTTAPTTAKRKRATKSVKEPEPKAVILSPGSAINTVNQQEVVFGTMSQLAREKNAEPSSPLASTGGPNSWLETSENPRLGDLATIRSNPNSQYDIDLEIEAFEELLASDSEPNTPTNKKPTRRNRALWDASARDLDGGLMDVDVIDLSKTPNALSISDDNSMQEDSRSVSSAEFLDPGWIPPSNQIPGPPTKKKAKSPLPSTPRDDITAFSPSIIQSTENDGIPRISTETEKPTMPNFMSFTLVELGQKLATFGFKPKRTKGEMAAILEQCWKSQHNQPMAPVVEQVDSNMITAHTAKAMTKKKTSPKRLDFTRSDSEHTDAGRISKKSTKARPRKKSASPPRQKSRQKQALGAPGEETDPRALITDPIDLQISEAIIAEKNTKPEEKCWWYKMLMYDPIIIEDFTVWLNVEGLGLVGVDDEVSKDTVKEWAERRGVTNVWKESNRGLERTRF